MRWLEDLERREREAYERTPDDPAEFAAWDKAAAWPEKEHAATSDSSDFGVRRAAASAGSHTRDSIIDRLSRITVAPVTSTIRGVASEVVLGPDDGMKNACAINLHNIVTVPKAGLGRLVVSLDPRRLDQVCTAIAFALGCGR